MNRTINDRVGGRNDDAAPIEWRHVVEIGSTNDALLGDAFDAHARAPVVLHAERQLAGRGRRGRRWISDGAQALTFSVALERDLAVGGAPLAGFSLAVGVSLAEALANAVPDIRLKWPNDLLRQGGKAGGILIESRRRADVERVVVGIGLNLLSPAPAARALHAEALPPVGLFDCSLPDGGEATMRACAQAVVTAFGQFSQSGLAGFIDRWHRFDALVGELVVLRDAEREITRGIALGIDPTGALRVRNRHGERAWAIGEVSLRPGLAG